MNKSKTELIDLRNDRLIKICKMYDRPHSSKTNPHLIATIKLGSNDDLGMTEAETILKCSFLAPLSNKDKSGQSYHYQKHERLYRQLFLVGIVTKGALTK